MIYPGVAERRWEDSMKKLYLAAVAAMPEPK